MAEGVGIRSPQIPHTVPCRGRKSYKQASQTGRREILTRGAPHRRQSEGNRVAKRLSAAALTQETKTGSTLALVARVRSSLLLKTNLPTCRRGKPHLSGDAPDASQVSIAALPGLGNAPFNSRNRFRNTRIDHRLFEFRLFGRGGAEPIRTPETIRTAERTAKYEGQQVLLRKGTSTRNKSNGMTAIRTAKLGEEHVWTPRIVNV
jgi:hypothetical protein